MGYIKHDTIVVISWDEDHFAAVHAKAVELLGAISDGTGTVFNYVSNIVDSRMNGQQAFLIAPDGSKEGWNTSDTAEAARAEFVGWLTTQSGCYCEALVVRFGGDDDGITVHVVKGHRIDRRPLAEQTP